MPGTLPGQISENSRRIAKNTLLLYFRMLLLMFIGLFTTRVVLKVLGESDYGVYNAVGGVVTVFTFITTSLSAAISRFLAFEIGKGDSARLKKVFSTSVVLQILLSLLMILLVETIGVWLLDHKLNIPDGRMPAAHWVLHFSLGVLVVNLMAVPFNATIIAHEKMSAFAVISILEAVLKLSVAYLLYVSVFDKLQTYAVLMFAVALLVRFTYGVYCRRHFEGSRGKLACDSSLMKEMAGMAGWSFFGSSAYVFNTSGVNLVVNAFFGVVANAARGIATQVEGIVKQFVSNFLTAINPQITKSYAAEDKEYCFELVRKASKYSMWTILLFMIPLGVWTPWLLDLWLKEVPAGSVAFVRLTLVGLLVDMTGNPFVTLVQATGKVKRYYLITGLVSYLCLPLVWVAFKLGAPATWAYICFIFIYLLVFGLKLAIVHKQTGFPIGRYFRALVTVTEGEKAYLFRKFGRFLPDKLYLKRRYYHTFGKKLNLKNPQTFNEKIQYQKLYDRNPLYHTLVDKAEVKQYVADKIGAQYVIPTLGVWNSVADIDWDSLPQAFMLKCTHDSGSNVLCADKSVLDRSAARTVLSKGLSRNFYRRDREWAYKGVKPRIIAEEYLGDNLTDYKFFCANGEVKFLFVATERSSSTEETKFDFFDADYKHITVWNGHPSAVVTPAKPELFEQMKHLASVLSEGMPQVRIDFYQTGGKLYFGEFTFYHWSGFMPFEPEEWDKTFGEWIG